MKDHTTFVIAHQLSTIRNADQILVLEEDVIIERDTHTDLIALRGRYFDLYTKQANIEANRFINPGEKEAEPDAEISEKKGRDDLTEVARDLLRFTGS